MTYTNALNLQLGSADFEGQYDDSFTGEMYRKWLPETRLVCKDFDTVVTPSVYQYTYIERNTLMEKLIKDSGAACSEFKSNICKHAASLEVSSNPEFMGFNAETIENCISLENL